MVRVNCQNGDGGGSWVGHQPHPRPQLNFRLQRATRFPILQDYSRDMGATQGGALDQPILGDDCQNSNLGIVYCIVLSLGGSTHDLER